MALHETLSAAEGEAYDLGKQDAEKAITATRIENILRLYRQMPGAPRIPTEDGFEMTGDVMGNDHWNFCEAIVDMMVAVSLVYSR